jgi:hypothetical protein
MLGGDKRSVRLLRNHEHGGTEYRAGTRLRVSKRLADFWIDNRIAADGNSVPVTSGAPLKKRGCGCGK